MTKFAGKYKSPTFKPKDVIRSPVVSSVSRRVTAFDMAPSRVTAGGNGSAPEEKRYTGTAMIGVATLHKSNAVPVFSTDEAKNMASMRR